MLARLFREEEGWPWVLVGGGGTLRGGTGSEGSKAMIGEAKGSKRRWVGQNGSLLLGLSLLALYSIPLTGRAQICYN